LSETQIPVERIAEREVMNRPKLIKRQQIMKQEQTVQLPPGTATTTSATSAVSKWVRNQQERQINPHAQFAALFGQKRTT
jgi:hypothetical protein